MTTHRASTIVGAPRQEVWEHIADFHEVWRFNPSVEKSYGLSDDSGLGAMRRCELTFPGATVDEVITGYVEGEALVIQLLGGEKMPPITDATVRIELTDTSGGTRVTATMTYSPRYGVVGRLLDRTIVAPKFGRAFQGIFAGLKHHSETGELVDAGTELPYDEISYSVA